MTRKRVHGARDTTEMALQQVREADRLAVYRVRAALPVGLRGRPLMVRDFIAGARYIDVYVSKIPARTPAPRRRGK